MKIPFASLLVAAAGVGLVPGLPASEARAQLTKTVTVSPASGPASPCRCQDVTIVVVYGTNGSITFVANDASVSPSNTSYSVSTNIDVGCPPGFDVMSGADVGAHTTNGGSGNGTTSVPGAASVGGLIARHAANYNANANIPPQCKPAQGQSASMTVTYTFTRPAGGQGCEGGECGYSLQIVIRFDGAGNPSGIS